ncbi:MAG TPA: hypothetical protein VGI06_00320 [Acidimicrobiales bacterium]
MDLSDFMTLLQRLDAEAITAAAAELDANAASAAGELSWWRATVEIDRQLKIHRAGRIGALSATQAAAAVTQAATAAGMVLPDARVTVVARAAADVARGLAVHAAAVDDLLRGCRHLVAA